MLYVLFGSHRDKIRDESHKMLSALAKKRPNAQVFRLTEGEGVHARLSELIESRGLFEDKHVVVLDFALGDDETRELAKERAKDMAESEHIFIVLEEKPDAPLKKAFQKYAQDMREFDAHEKKEERFNVFSLADAVARRDRKGAWVALSRALAEDIAPEEIHGVLWWQIKTLLLVARGDTEGLKPFAVTKAKGALKNYSEDELRTISKKLLSMYHSARAGGPSLDIALEQFVLGL
ncbi:MAG: hypothetical protein AMXMBFR44_0140 [Candidatus Campbellbacteria bacterium]